MTERHSPVKIFSLRTRYLPLLIIPVVVIVSFGYFHIWNREAPLTVAAVGEWIPVRPQRLEQQLGLVGHIESASRETLSAPFDGTIREVLVQEGTMVHRGQPLIRMDTSLMDIQLRQAEAELLRAQKEAQMLENWEHSPDVIRARRAVQSARVSLDSDRASLQGTQELFRKGIVARMEVDALAQQVFRQQQELQTAQEELSAVEARGQGDERKIAEMQLLNTRLRYQTLQAQRSTPVLKAPFTGIVVHPTTSSTDKTIDVQPGAQVSQGSPLLTVIDSERLQVLTQVDESDLYLLREGMPVLITGEGFSGQVLSGKISTVAVQSNTVSSPDSSSRYDVVVSVDSPQSKNTQMIRLGMSARIAVILYENEHGIAVPPLSLHSREDGTVWVNYRPALDKPATRVNVVPGPAVTQGIKVQGLQEGFVQVSAR